MVNLANLALLRQAIHRDTGHFSWWSASATAPQEEDV